MTSAKDAAERIYRAGKVKLLNMYQEYIQTEVPDHIGNPGLVQVFEQSWAA